MASTCGQLETLAKSKSVKVAQCGCGTIHVAYSHATLHFKEDSLHELYLALGQSLASLSAKRLREQPPLRLGAETPEGV